MIWLCSDVKKMNKIEEEIVYRLNSYPTNCYDLGKLGYTLNGFYIVNGNDLSATGGGFRVHFCQFKLPSGAINSKYIKKNQNYLRCLTIKIFIVEIITTKEERFGVIRLLDEPSPRRANLINGDGRCVHTGSIHLYQWRCDPPNEMSFWSWNEVSLGSRDRHICNRNERCIASPSNVERNTHPITWCSMDEKGQRFSLIDLPAYPGFFFIKNDHGKCVSLPEYNKDDNGTHIWATDCNPFEASQRWKWQYE